MRAGSEGNRSGCTHDPREAVFPGKTCEGPLHAYFTLTSQACMKHDKRLFAVWPTSPPPAQECHCWAQDYVEKRRRVFFFIMHCAGVKLKAATLPLLVITLP